MTAVQASATSRARRLQTRRLSGALGAEILGVDLSRPLDDATFAEIRDIFLDNIVIVLRDQAITPAQQAAFMERFGKVEPHPLGSRRGVEGHPQVMVLENLPGKLGPRNDIWHSDLSYDEVPPAASMLFAITMTEGRADTMFCNMYAAYEELSDGLKRVLAGLTAMHTAEPLVLEVPSRLAIRQAPPAVEHPVVRTHPETGRKALYVNPWYTSHFAGWTPEESRPLLEYLFQRATRPENVYRHHWRVGDVLMWDNRSAMHYGVRDYDDTMPRLMHRVTASGDRPR
jgi:taurine dioxygenase